MVEQIKNFAYTTLAEDLDNSETVITVTDGSVFPSSGNFPVVVDTEIMLCTSRSSNDLTVTRGQESTGAVTHANGAQIRHVLTTGSFARYLEELTGLPGGTSFPSSPATGRMYFRTDVRGGMMFRYDGTRWLSDQLLQKVLCQFNSITADTTTYQVPFENDYSVYLVGWHGTYFLSANSATWVFNLDHIPFRESDGYTNLDSASTSTYGNTLAQWYLFRKPLGIVKTTTSGNTAGNISGLRINIDEQAGVAGFYGLAWVEYRLIAT